MNAGNRSLWQSLSQARVYDLAQPYFVGMPHFPTHPPFLFSLTKLHGEYVGPNGVSSAADSIAMAGHTGTHIDALNHFSCNGLLHGDVEVESVQGYAHGVGEHAVSGIEPIVRRGVLLDIARLDDTDALEFERLVTADDLERAAASQQVSIEPGDIVLLRTGLGQHFDDPSRYVNETRMPGPGLEAARWLSSRKIFAAGSDTLAFERIPDPAMPVHVHFLVERGIHILENLNLEQLALDEVWEFTLVAAPLKIEGGTGAPIRPLALVGG